jgi:hypothetical protein
MHAADVDVLRTAAEDIHAAARSISPSGKSTQFSEASL